MLSCPECDTFKNADHVHTVNMYITQYYSSQLLSSLTLILGVGVKDYAVVGGL